VPFWASRLPKMPGYFGQIQSWATCPVLGVFGKLGIFQKIGHLLAQIGQIEIFEDTYRSFYYKNSNLQTLSTEDCKVLTEFMHKLGFNLRYSHSVHIFEALSSIFFYQKVNLPCRICPKSGHF
jgi:hypothetical protein